MNDGLMIVLTAGLVASGCGLLGPFLVLRREALMGDAVSHAVLPGIVAVFLLLGTRATVPVVIGAAVFAVVCVLLIDALRSTGLVRDDAAIGLVFPVLFALGVLGVQQYADDLHLDLDSTIYGEIAFVPALWKELKAASFDPSWSRTAGFAPTWLGRGLLVMVAVTAVVAFDHVGAILVVTLLIVPAATANLLTDSMRSMVAVTVALGWVAALGGYWIATAVDASIAGAMGLVAGGCFAIALVAAPRHGLIARAR